MKNAFTQNLHKNTGGFTLVEVLVSAVVLIVVFLALTTLYLNEKKFISRIQVSQNQSKMAANLVQTIIDTLQESQISFADEKIEVCTSSDCPLDPDKLPMAISSQYQGSAANCASCPLRYGYVIQRLSPNISGNRGMFKVLLRVADGDLVEKTVAGVTSSAWVHKSYKDYSLLVTAK